MSYNLKWKNQLKWNIVSKIKMTKARLFPMVNRTQQLTLIQKPTPQERTERTREMDCCTSVSNCVQLTTRPECTILSFPGFEPGTSGLRAVIANQLDYPRAIQIFFYKLIHNFRKIIFHVLLYATRSIYIRVRKKRF